jgi:hypothetical protein
VHQKAALKTIAPHAQNFALDQLHPLLGFALVSLRALLDLLDLLDLELDPEHGSPVERRAQVARSTGLHGTFRSASPPAGRAASPVRPGSAG